MKPCTEMTDDELGEAILELAAPRVRMAAPEDLRKVADMLAALAVEAAGRMKERSTDRTLGALMGKIRNVVLHADGRLTADLTVNDAGAEFVRQVRGAATDGIGFRS